MTRGDVEKLILRVAQGNRGAFQTLYDETSAKLFGIGLRVLNDRAEAEDIAPQTPPDHVWPGIEADLFRTELRTPVYRRLILWGGALTAAAAVMLVVGYSSLFDPAPLPPVDAPYVAEPSAEDGSLAVRAIYDDATGRLFVEREAGGPAPGRALELWLIAGEDAPVSLGVLPDDPRAVVPVPDEMRDRFAGSALAISDEPEGGSPTGAPTGDILAVGQVREI